MGLKLQERGLRALNEARRQRRRTVVFGRVRMREAATGFWLMTFVGLAIFSFAYHRYSLVELDAKRGDVLARRRAVALAVGTGGFELRDRIEGWVIALARGNVPEGVSPDVQLEQLTEGPSIFVRLRLSDAQTVEGIRSSAKGSLRDGFTSCLFAGSAPDLRQGRSCSVTSQCGPGELCSDWNVCAAPAHPYNLRLLYDGLRVLTPEWEQQVAAVTDEMQLRVLDLELKGVEKHEAVAAVALVRRSKYFAVVLDEDAPMGSAGLSPPIPGESPSEWLQAQDHGVRVGIWDILHARPLVVLRLEAGGLLLTGSAQNVDATTLRVQRRQANNCSIATQVREALLGVREKREAPVTGASAAGVP